MARSAEKSPAYKMLVCRSCKKEYTSYKRSGPLQCPHCGRQVKKSGSRKALVVAILLIVLGLAAAALVILHVL